MTGNGHLLAEHFIALFLAQLCVIVRVSHLGLAQFAILAHLLFVFGEVDFLGSNFVEDITGYGAVDIVEFLKSVKSDHTLNIGGLFFASNIRGLADHATLGLARCHAPPLVLGEDVTVAGHLGGRSTGLVVSLLQRLQGAVVKTAAAGHLTFVVIGFLVETVAHTLSERINASIRARSLGLLVADTLVVALRVEGASVSRQFNRLALRRHLSLRSRSATTSCPLSDIGTTRLRDGVVFGSWSPSGCSHVVESLLSIGTSCQHWVLDPLLSPTISDEMLGELRESAGTFARATCGAPLLTL